MTRRDFLGRCTAVSVVALLPPCAQAATTEEKLKGDWSAMLKDPVRKLFPRQPNLDRILTLFPRTTGEPAFNPTLIARNVKELRTNPAVDTGHPFLDLSVRTGLAHIDATFQGDHPKYGVNEYGGKVHDGFPPTIIAAVDALSAWGMHVRAAQLFRYWLAHFVRDDGTISYYGPSLSEYGQLLHTAASLTNLPSARMHSKKSWANSKPRRCPSSSSATNRTKAAPAKCWGFSRSPTPFAPTPPKPSKPFTPPESKESSC